MHTTAKATLLITSLLACASAAATTVQGRLELQWGDPIPGPNPQRGEVLRATLVTDEGRRFALDPAQAVRAADDLSSLFGKRVAVEFSAQAKGVSLYSVEAIVPVDASAKAGDKILGNTQWATLMCKFNDIPTEQKPLSFFQSQYGNTQGQLDHYWREVSYDKINLVGSNAYGWVTLPQPRSFYVTGTGQGSANLNQLFDDCTAAADAQVNFAANGGLQGINMMFNGDLDGFAWGGGRCVTLDGINKCWSTTWNPPWSFNNLSPLAHEMGHGYGLPHANNSDNDSDPYDNPWDVMSDAWSNAASDPTYGSVAKHISTYHRDRLGWIDAARKLTLTAGSSATGISLDRASLRGSTQPQMIVVRVPGDPTTRYYTIESRKRVGYYDAMLAGNAVIIHQIDTTRSTPAWSMDADVPPANRANNEGSMFKVGERWTAPNGAFNVRVDAETANGFVVSVCGGGAPASNGPITRFDSCKIGLGGTPTLPRRTTIVPRDPNSPTLPGRVR